MQQLFCKSGMFISSPNHKSLLSAVQTSRKNGLFWVDFLRNKQRLEFANPFRISATKECGFSLLQLYTNEERGSPWEGGDCFSFSCPQPNWKKKKKTTAVGLFRHGMWFLMPCVGLSCNVPLLKFFFKIQLKFIMVLRVSFLRTRKSNVLSLIWL